MAEDTYRKELLNRLRTIKGHITGIEKMIEDKKNCQDILLQIAAVRSSVNKVGLLIMEDYARDCFLNPNEKDKFDIESLEDIIDTVINYLK